MYSLLYIDPGTGSMLFTIVIGLISTLIFAFRDKFMKLKFILNGGKAVKADADKLPIVIFADDKRYWNLYEPICDELEKRQVKAAYWTASPDDPALVKDYKHVKCEFIGEGNKAFARLNMVNARVCFSTTPGLDVFQWKRSKKCDYYVHIHHAVEEGTGYRMFGMDFFDAILCSGNTQKVYLRKLEDARKLPHKECKIVGCTYMDSLLSRYQERKALDEANGGRKDHDFTVLVAPSWGEDAILNKFGEAILDALVETGFNIVVRPHPQSMTAEKDMMDRLLDKYKENDKFHWDFSRDNFETLYNADIMITDFSGIIFDYCYVFDKPLIYADTKMDTAPYDAAWLNEPVWRLAILPELGKCLDEKDFPNMKEVIESVSDSEVFRQGRYKYKADSWHEIGKAAGNVVDYLQDKCAELEASDIPGLDTEEDKVKKKGLHSLSFKSKKKD